MKIHISETALFYFFSSIAQSMAAIIALAGTVAIFRYSFLTDKLKDSRTSLKEKLSDRWLAQAVGLSRETRYLSDDELVRNADDCIKSGNLVSSTKEEIGKGLLRFMSY